AGAGALEDAARRRPGWIALAVAAGAVLPVQGAINARLNAELDATVAVGAFSFLVATAAMSLTLGAILAAGAARPRVEPLRGVPWWGWLGGLCGATYVTSVFMLIPEIGAAPVVVLTVAGQQLASVAVDRYGLLRLPRRAISGRRLAGVAVLVAGVALITLG
ncbi:MAG: DMT family transporter, partial [Thermoleophilaceae bacterium]